MGEKVYGDFGWALIQLKKGNKVCREGWNGKGMCIYKVDCELPYPPLSKDDGWKDGIFGTDEFLVMLTADDKLVPWLASQTDILAEDWLLVE
jgi:hypothetical protein